MAYFFYTITFVFLISATALYLTRHLWTPHAPPIPYLTAPGRIPEPLYNLSQSLSRLNPFRHSSYIRLSNSSFQSDLEAGFSTSNFDLQQNLDDGDSRRGLDDEGKATCQRIMKERGVGFDEARRIVMEERFGRENIGKDGRPRDPKAVMFDRM